jgi:hypothetical protein
MGGLSVNLYIGILGMVFLLTGFVLNLMKVVRENSVSYILLNIFGAGISTYYAWALDAIPFIILEAVWCFFAVYKLTVVLK